MKIYIRDRVKYFLLLLPFCMLPDIVRADERVVQFSGYVMTADSLMGVGYAHITILNRGRVATAAHDGYFSFAAQEGDTCFFTCVGFQPSVYVIPRNLASDKFSVIQLMSRSELYLRETIVYPWGKRENFRQAFLDLKISDDELARAEKNLSRERMIQIAEKLEKDGPEYAKQNQQARAASFYYYKQQPPQNIFNPLAWAEFIRAWKRGEFKKKEKTEGEE